MECDGSGLCLTTFMICNFNCTQEECGNFFVCNNTAPRFILNFNNGLCNDCCTKFGAVLFKVYNIDCPVCLQIKELGSTNPRCIHVLCISCLKSIYWDDPNISEFINEPKFPYPSLENDYYENPGEFINDELINSWKKNFGSWNSNRINYIFKNRKYLKRCPICRG